MTPLSTEQAIALSEYTTSGFGDDGGYSALHRPGSWEWQLPHAADAREKLVVLGYEARVDPDAAWRVQWWNAVPHNAETAE